MGDAGKHAGRHADEMGWPTDAQMAAELPAARLRLARLGMRIAEGDVGRAEQLWQGAKVLVVEEMIPEDPEAFYALRLHARSDFAHELSWLMEQVRDSLGILLDARNKYWFYESLIEAAILAIDSPLHGPERIERTLVTVLTQAQRNLEAIDAVLAGDAAA